MNRTRRQRKRAVEPTGIDSARHEVETAVTAVFCKGCTAGAAAGSGGRHAGCAGATVADHVPTAIDGLPDAAPPRPGAPSAYPAVNEVPAPRDNKVLTSEEQYKIEDELIAARNRVSTLNASNGKR